MNNKVMSYEAPRTWIVELEPAATLANSYGDGGDGFTVNWNRDSSNDFKW
ncbi:MAG: hypothetical protein IJT26_04450 [Bacteroidales bacterium]|nr:hypothetical protein [Bacteroidales bacterium]